jgi:hypothetical protein
MDYDSSFIIRGLSELHLKLTPSPALAGITPAIPAKSKPQRKGFFSSIFGKRAEKLAASTSYSTAETKIGDLLADPAARVVMDKYFPGVTGDTRIGLAKNMTFRRVQKFAPEMFTNEALDAADAELAKLPVR